MQFRSLHSPNGAVAIDGVVAADRAAPGSANEVAELLVESSRRGAAVIPAGGGTALALGNPPERADLLLATENLAGVIDYEPTDLVLSVGAGARLGDVQAILGEHGQRLPIDPPGGSDATIGGLIATARWGPLRHSAGTLRDLLIGISVAHSDGTVSKAGGMVVKNVSGYDMPRLYHGSLGTLGVITSANFKVLPRPRAEATVLAKIAAPEAAFIQAREVRTSGAPLAALEVCRREGAWITAARIEGREPTVRLVRETISASLGEDVLTIDDDASRAWWDTYVADQQARPGTQEVVLRCAVRPRDLATLAPGVFAVVEKAGGEVQMLAASPGIGTLVIRFDLGDRGSAETLAAIQALLLDLADAVTILAAPPAWKQGIDVWGRLPDGFDVMQALRAQFDPPRTINPGRFAGFL